MDYEHVDDERGLAVPATRAPHRVVFEAWSASDAVDDNVAGAYSREAWFPVVGAAAWLVWCHIVRRLRANGAELAWTIEELSDDTAVAVDAVSWGLLQLTRYDLARGVGENRWLVRTVCPPLHDKLLPRASATVRRWHEALSHPGRTASFPVTGIPTGPRLGRGLPVLAVTVRRHV